MYVVGQSPLTGKGMDAEATVDFAPESIFIARSERGIVDRFIKLRSNFVEPA